MKVFDPELDKQLGLLAAGGALAIETYHLEDGETDMDGVGGSW